MPGAHKIGAAISGPRIADGNFMDITLFLMNGFPFFTPFLAQKFGELFRFGHPNPGKRSTWKMSPPKFHAKFHDTFGRENGKKNFTPHFCRVAALRSGVFRDEDSVLHGRCSVGRRHAHCWSEILSTWAAFLGLARSGRGSGFPGLSPVLLVLGLFENTRKKPQKHLGFFLPCEPLKTLKNK